MSTPQAGARPQVKISFSADDLSGEDFGRLFTRLEFKGMVNDGYVVRLRLMDPEYGLLNRLLEAGYLRDSRRTPLKIIFQIKWDDTGTFPNSATQEQVAYVIALKADGRAPDEGFLDFVAVDPPAWFLNIGDGSGKVWKGKVSDVIRQVVEKYAPALNLTIGDTTDSERGKWYMMRQDPKTFIESLLNWSSAITESKTHWLVTSDGEDLTIMPQGDLPSVSRAYYKYWSDVDHDTIKSWEFLADNALSLVQTKIITQGISATSGQYLDRITDVNEEHVFVRDSTTDEKQVANITADQGFTGPPEGEPPIVGWTALRAVPEIYSAGDLGKQYGDYIDGNARSIYLKMSPHLMRMKLRCLGHGEWSGCTGLGVDTIFVHWRHSGADDQANRLFFISGNWLVYGFHHVVTLKDWYTDVYTARSDFDAIGKRVP